MRVLPLVVQGPETTLGELLWGLTCKVATYPGVRGMLYRRVGEGVAVWIVVSSPMSRPMRLLAAVWARELWRADPGRCWSLRVHDDAPKADGTFRCLFWRTF